MINYPKNMVVISPHPDDETLGTGGTIVGTTQKNGTKVSILEVSGHLPPFMKIGILKLLKKEALRAFKILGVHNYEFLKIPTAMVHTLPVSEINKDRTLLIKLLLKLF